MHTTDRYTHTHNRGLTLVETVVFIAVFVVIIGAIVAALQYMYKGQRFVFEQSDASRSARTGIDRIVRNLREVSYADDGAYSVESMSTSSMVFFSDFDNDERVERVRYFLEDGNVKRGVVESAGTPPEYDMNTEVVQVISDYVRNEALGIPLFTFFDTEGDEMNDYSAVADVAFVTVRLVVNIHPESAPIDYELRSSATLRNVH